jgi:tetraacyldisaccharide 4'-kinase
MRWYRCLLYPLAILYDLATAIRNSFFEIGLLKMKKSAIPSIVVGNLSVGGTGKTPMIEFLIRMLYQDQKIATLSRGYGRQTKGFLKATSISTPFEIGDEPFQILKKFDPDISVYVGEDRVSAAEKIALATPETNLLLLDDAFQHRYLKPDLAILLTTFFDLFSEDYLMPMGSLRESRKGARRADAIVVTKSPLNISQAQRLALSKKIIKYTGPDTPIFFSSTIYGKPYSLTIDFKFSDQVILFSGLSNDQALKQYVSSNFKLESSFTYPDHHSYSLKDFTELREAFEKSTSNHVVFLTTEKDAGKVKSSAPAGFLEEIPIFVLPIEVVIPEKDLAMLEELIQLKVLNKGRIQ